MRTNTEKTAWNLVEESVNYTVPHVAKPHHGYWHIIAAILLTIAATIVPIILIKLVLIFTIPSILQTNRTF